MTIRSLTQLYCIGSQTEFLGMENQGSFLIYPLIGYSSQLKGALLEEVVERADDSVMPTQPDCESCLVSCLGDDVSVNQTEKQLRCRAEVAQWKRVQLCRARQREAPVFFKHIHKAGGVFLCNALARKNMKVG